MLHPGHDPAFHQMLNNVEQHQEHEDQHDLDEDQPPGVGAEVLRCRGRRVASGNRVIRPLPSGSQCRRAGRRRRGGRGRWSWPGTQTTSSPRSAAITAGQGDRAAVTGDGDARGPGRRTAVALTPDDGRARGGAQVGVAVCIVPLSSSCFQAARVTPGPWVDGGVVDRTTPVRRGRRPRGPSRSIWRGPRRPSGSRAAGRAPRRCLPGRAGRAARRRAEDRVERARAPLPGDEHARLLTHGRRRGRPRRRPGSRRSLAAPERPRTTRGRARRGTPPGPRCRRGRPRPRRGRGARRR